MFRVLAGIGLMQLAVMLFQLVRTKALALLLGPEQVGIMAVIDKLLAVIAQTASLSLPFAAVRFLPARWEESPAAYAHLYRQMRRVLAGAVLPATALALAASVLAPGFGGDELVDYADVVVVAVLGIPVLAFVPFLQNAVAGRMQQHWSMLVALGQSAIAALAVLGVRPWGLSGFYALNAALGLGLVVPLALALGRSPGPPPAPRSGDATLLGLPRSVWRFSGAMLLLAFAAPYAALFVHYAVLRDLGAVRAGWMQAALGIGLAVRIVLGSAHPVFLTPNVNRGGAPEERMAWANRFQETFCLLALLLVPPLLLVPELVIRLLYSAAFVPGATFVVVFVVVELVGLLSGTYQSLIVAFDHLRFHVLQNLLAQGAIVAAASLLIGPLGILGAGVALLAAPILLLLSTLVFLDRAHGLRVSARARRLGLLLAVAVVAAGLVGALTSTLSITGMALRLGLLVLTLLAVGFNLAPEERVRLQALVSRGMIR